MLFEIGVRQPGDFALGTRVAGLRFDGQCCNFCTGRWPARLDGGGRAAPLLPLLQNYLGLHGGNEYADGVAKLAFADRCPRGSSTSLLEAGERTAYLRNTAGGAEQIHHNVGASNLCPEAPALDRSIDGNEPANDFYGLVVGELLAEKRIIVGLAAGIGFFALGHGAMALTAGLVGRALVSERGSFAGAWGWSLLSLCYLGLGAALVKSIASICLAFAESRSSFLVGSRLRIRVSRSLLEHGLHDSAPRVLATIAVRIREAELATVAGALTLMRASAQLMPLALGLIWLSPQLALGAALALVPFALLLAAMRRRWRAASERAQSLIEELHTGTDELVKNLDVWRSYGQAERVEQLIARAGERASRAEARVEAARAALSGCNEVLGAMALLGAVVLARELRLPLGDGTLIAFATMFFMAYRPLRDLGDARAQCARGSAAVAAVSRLGYGSSVRLPPKNGTLAHVVGKLSVREFGAARDLARTSFEVHPGELVCVTGPTGSGKTTLLRALLGLEPAVGELIYAHRELTSAGVGPHARPFAWVPQDAPLVTGTIRDNVSLFSAEHTQACLALGQIGAAHLLQYPSDEIVGPGGRPLSGGESRQVAIARALCTGLPVLLLDEPTEGLDAEAREHVAQALQRLRGKRTLIVVTHRPELSALADRVVRIGVADSRAGEERQTATHGSELS